MFFYNNIKEEKEIIMGANKNDENTYIIELVDVYYKIKNGKIKAKAKIKDDDDLERLMKEFFGEKQK